MLIQRAQPRNAISSPANGNTGQKPRLARNAAIAKEMKHTLKKNSNADRTLSEQCGQISMRCGLGGTDQDGTARDSICKSKTYERKSAPQLFTTANARMRVRLERKHGQRLTSELAFQGG